MKRLELLGLLFALAISAPANAEHLVPRDECGSQSGAEGFQMALATAVANRDEALLQPLIDPRIVLDFGGGSGWELLRGRLRSPEYDLWSELDSVIRLGCGSDEEGSLSMPYYWGQDFGDLDAFATYIVLGSRIPLYRASDGTGVVRWLNWEAVEFIGAFNSAEEREDANRWKVTARDGATGFVEREKLRSLVDYRLIANRGSDGNWRISYFVAGD